MQKAKQSFSLNTYLFLLCVFLKQFVSSGVVLFCIWYSNSETYNFFNIEHDSVSYQKLTIIDFLHQNINEYEYFWIILLFFLFLNIIVLFLVIKHLHVYTSISYIYSWLYTITISIFYVNIILCTVSLMVSVISLFLCDSIVRVFPDTETRKLDPSFLIQIPESFFDENPSFFYDREISHDGSYHGFCVANSDLVQRGQILFTIGISSVWMVFVFYFIFHNHTYFSQSQNIDSVVAIFFCSLSINCFIQILAQIIINYNSWDWRFLFITFVSIFYSSFQLSCIHFGKTLNPKQLELPFSMHNLIQLDTWVLYNTYQIVVNWLEIMFLHIA